VQQVIVSRPVAPIDGGEVEFEVLPRTAGPARQAGRHARGRPRLLALFVRIHGRPKGTVLSHANPYWTAELYGKGVLAAAGVGRVLLAAKLFFAYGLGNALTFPMSVGATVLLMAERPTPDATFKRWTGGPATRSRPRFFGAPTVSLACSRRPRCRRASRPALRLVSSAGEALPAEIASASRRTSASTSSTALARPRCCTSSCRTGPSACATAARLAVPGYDIELRGEPARPCPTANPVDLYIPARARR
jgi:benzoate-CoA ligase